MFSDITIEITQKCNSNCIFCSSCSNIDTNIQLELNDIKRIIKFCKYNNVKQVCISGGEPLLHSDFIDIINYIHSNKIYTNIYTSGCVSNACINNTLQVDKTMTKFIFNVPSINNDAFQKLIDSNCFNTETVYNNIQLCINNNFYVEAHIVPNKINIHTLYDTCYYLKTIGVKQVSLLKLVLQGRAYKNAEELLITDYIMLQQTINKLKLLECKTFTIRTGIPFNDITSNKCKCIAGINKLVFRYDGLLFPCEAFKMSLYNELFTFGNINDNTISYIYNNKQIHTNINYIKNTACYNNESCPAQLLYKEINND